MIPNKNYIGQIKGKLAINKIKYKPNFICSFCHKVLPLKQMANKVTWLDGKPVCKRCKKKNF